MTHANARTDKASSHDFVSEVRQQMVKGSIGPELRRELSRRLKQIRQYGAEYEGIDVSPELRHLMSQSPDSRASVLESP